jgi:type I restriction enzyme, R subunit
MSPSEQDARILIDDMLRTVGWDLKDRDQIRTEVPVFNNQVISETMKEHPYSKEDIRPTGYADYVLYSQNGRPLAVVEAKKEAFHPYVAKKQALPYAKSLGAPFIFLTNGELIYFWDYTNDDARAINAFYSQRDLERIIHLREVKQPLATIQIPDYYLRQGERRELRPYQKETMQALDKALELGKRRFLIELPTGTGKTDLITLYLKRLFEAGRAERVLFLVDREQLAKQALEALQDILTIQYGSYWLKSGMERHEQQITVSLLQTMISKFRDYSSGYFDVVIADECHRSIYGAWQTALTHFDAVHIGLTATPSRFIERNTFRFYQCEDGKPDFSYSFRDAIKPGYLVPYKFAEGITTIIAEGADVDDEHYDPIEFERRWTNEDTNRKMMEEFDRLAWDNYKELAPGQKTGPGKSIVFAITKHHAARLAYHLNQLHPEFKGEYAAVITSDVPEADDLIRKFKHETYPMVAVSVGMLDTGFDCREVLHLVMCRRIRSPILYQQMRGRGTRTCSSIKKRGFVIYDFFENRKFFNDTENDVFEGGGGSGGGGEPRPIPEPRELIELGLEDEWLYAVNYVEVGPEGEKIDSKKYVSVWKETIQQEAQDDPILQKIRRQEEAETEEERDALALTEDEEKKLAERLNSPEMYFNEDNLRRAYKKPSGTLVDFVKHALCKLKMKSREEELTENFYAWMVTKSFTPDQAQYLSLIKNRGIVRGKVDMNDLFKPPLSMLNAAGLGVDLFGESGLKNIISELNEEVFHHKAM